MSQVMEYKCPYCGGIMEFNPSTQTMKCPYCDSEIAVSELEHMDDHLKEDESGQVEVQDQNESFDWNTQNTGEFTEEETSGMAVFTCTACGGEIVADENLAATSCPYCGNPVMLTGRLKGALKPDYIIPFKWDKKQAKLQFQKFISGKKLLPKIFKDENHIDEIKGMYVPFWIFDGKADAHMTFKGTKMRTWSDRDYNYTETRYFEVERAGKMEFVKIPVDGSSKMADDLMESIEPFDFSEAVDFQTAYMSGYLADKYDVTKGRSKVRADARIKQSACDVLRNDVTDGYASLTLKSSDINLYDQSAKYAMYPVWILNTTFQGQHYMFAMNGQTGRFAGDLPVDKKAYWMWFGIYAAAFTAIGTLLLSLFM